MHLDRRRRRWLSGWLIVVLLFTQLATAAYACPKGLTSAQTAADMANMAEMATMADMPNCEGSLSRALDPGQTQLCKAHCEQGAQSVHPTVAGDPPSAAVLLAVLDWTPVTLTHAPSVRRADSVSSGAPPPGALPLYLSLLVLRN